MRERIQMCIVFSLTAIAMTCIITAMQLEATGRASPNWLGVVAGSAAGGLLALANPGGRSNGNGTETVHPR